MESPRLKALESQIAELSPEEVKSLAEQLALRSLLADATAKTVEWERFSGVISTTIDGVEYQNAVRAEWN
jgi:hypothetical protein